MNDLGTMAEMGLSVAEIAEPKVKMNDLGARAEMGLSVAENAETRVKMNDLVKMAEMRLSVAETETKVNMNDLGAKNETELSEAKNVEIMVNDYDVKIDQTMKNHDDKNDQAMKIRIIPKSEPLSDDTVRMYDGKISSVRMPNETLKGSALVRMSNVQNGLNEVIMPENDLVILPKLNVEVEADGAKCATGLSLGLMGRLVAERAESGLSLEVEKRESDPNDAGVDAAGGAALGLERVRAECMPYEDDEGGCKSGLSLEIGGEEVPRVARASTMKRDENDAQIVKTINKKQSASDYLKRSMNLNESLEECKKKIENLKNEKRKNDYLKVLFKCEEIDLENFDLAEALVMEVIENCFEQSLKKDKEELRKVTKKRKLNTDCDTNTKKKEKEIVHKKQKLENLQHQEAATPTPTTPGPIGIFLEGFKFKTKIKKQDCISKQNPQNPPPPEEKNEKEIFMSKFARLKSKFEKEKVKNVKSCKKKENPKTKMKMTCTPVRQAATATTNTTSTPTTKDTYQNVPPAEPPITTVPPTTTKLDPTTNTNHHQNRTCTPVRQTATTTTNTTSTPTTKDTYQNVPPTKPLLTTVPPTTTKPDPTTISNHHQNLTLPSDISLTRFPSNMWEPNGNRRVQIRYGGTASVPPGTTLHNMALCAGLKTPKITSITPTTPTHAPRGSLPPNRQQKPPHLVPPKVWGESSDDSEPPRNVATLSDRRVEDIVKMFGTTADVKTTKKPGRWPATRKTAENTARILDEEDDLGTTQGVPKIVNSEFDFKNICDRHDKICVEFSDFGRQPPVTFVSAPTINLHEPLPDDVPAVQPTCTTSEIENEPKIKTVSQNLALRLPWQPVQPTQEQL